MLHLLNPLNWFARGASPTPRTQPTQPTPSARSTAHGVRAREIQARYDAAQTNDDNKKHWAAADHLSADASNNIAVRRSLRTRSRYETANNSNLKGMVRTLAIDTVGTGPTLQMQTADDDVNSAIEDGWAQWAKEIRLAKKLRIMRRAKCDGGEVFAIFVTNPRLQSPVKLDVKLVEADQVTDVTWESWADPNKSDGIFYDDDCNPISYRVLKYHPGSLNWGFSSLKYDDIAAALVFHYGNDEERPGNRRCVPEISPALGIFPVLRRWGAAALDAAETAADYAMTIESDGAAIDDSDDPDPMDTIELRRRMATVIPKGWKMSQTKAEQPTTSYGDFHDKKLAEGARCIDMPFSIAALDSSKATTSARYMDGQIYSKGVEIERVELEVMLDRLLCEWLAEASLSLLPDGTALIPAPLKTAKHQWFWPVIVEHADPDKVASADSQNLKSGTTHRARLYAERGLDVDDEDAKAAASLDMTVAEYRAMIRTNLSAQTGGMPTKPEPAAASE